MSFSVVRYQFMKGNYLNKNDAGFIALKFWLTTDH